MQVVEPGVATVPGLQLMESNVRVAWALTVTTVERLAPPPDAVMVTVWVPATEAAVRVKLAALAPAVTLILAGAGSAGLLLDNATAKPPAGAVLLRVTVQPAAWPEVRLAGLHERAAT